MNEHILIKMEHPEMGIWYFTNTNRAAQYIGTSATNVWNVLKGTYKAIKGWTAEYIEGDNIIYKYINPEK